MTERGERVCPHGRSHDVPSICAGGVPRVRGSRLEFTAICSTLPEAAIDIRASLDSHYAACDQLSFVS